MAEALILVGRLALGLGVILLVARAGGAIARRLGQPPVVGEITGGVLLGPSLFDGRLTATLFPGSITPALEALATVGIAVFMFRIGREFDASWLRRSARTVGVLCAGSLALPAACGALIALWLATRHPQEHGTTALVVFMALAMSVTAFPVLARIVLDRGLLGSTVGDLSLAVAAVGDVLAWTALAILTAVVSSGGSPWRLLAVVPLAAASATVVPRLFASPWLARLPRPLPAALLAVGLVVWVGVADWSGLHVIFGAFLFGLAMPRDGAARALDAGVDRAIHVTGALLMPIYFAVAGFHVDLSRLGAGAAGELAVILAVAFGGKMLGVYGAARTVGMERRPATALASLMNTRGLTELVVLGLGLSLGVLSPALYSSMVVMTVVTTAAAGPLLRLTSPEPPDARAGRERVGATGPPQRVSSTW